MAKNKEERQKRLDRQDKLGSSADREKRRNSSKPVRKPRKKSNG